MRPLNPRQIDQRLGKLEAISRPNDESAFSGLVFLHGDEPESEYPSGTCVIRFVEPKSRAATEYRLPHNGRDPWPTRAA